MGPVATEKGAGLGVEVGIPLAGPVPGRHAVAISGARGEDLCLCGTGVKHQGGKGHEQGHPERHYRALTICRYFSHETPLATYLNHWIADVIAHQLQMA